MSVPIDVTPGRCAACGAGRGEKCDPNGHMAPPAETVDERRRDGMEWAHGAPGFPTVVVMPDDDNMVRLTLAEVDSFLRRIGYRSRRYSRMPVSMPEPAPPTFGECVEHARASLMAAEALIAQGGGALADVHANVAAGWGTLAMVLGNPEPPAPHRMRHFGGQS